MNKRKLASGAVSIALAVTMLSTTAFAAAASFSDVDSKHWAAPSITEMADRGVMTGVGNNIFAPDKTLTYAEFITMVVRQFYPDKIVDVKGEWYAPYMAVAESAGILKGTEVSAEATIDRYNMAQVMYNVMQDQKMATSPLTDTSKVADWSSVPTAYQDAVSVCYNMGMLSGVDGKGTFNGTGVMTRAQAAVVMDRLIGDEQVAPTPGEIPEGALELTGDNVLRLQATQYIDGKFVMSCNGITSTGSSITINPNGHARLTFTAVAMADNQRVCVGDTSSLMGELLLAEALETGTPKTYTVDVAGVSEIQINIRNGRLSNAEIYDIYLS